MLKRCFMLLCFSILIIISDIGFGLAQESEKEEVGLERIVVTPSRSEEPIGQVAGSITVISGEEMKERGIFTALEALRDEVGIGIDPAQSGGFGGTTSIFLRGANSGQTRVMIDGVRVYDPIVTNAAFEFAHLTLDNIDRIEVLKGPQSVLYGTDAIGGVINILTKKGEGKPKINLVAEGGSFYTYRQGLDINGESDRLHFSFGASHLRSKGFSKKREKDNNPENDRYENYSLSLRLDYDLSEASDLGLTARYTDARFEIDDFNGDDPNRQSSNRQILVSPYLNYRISDWWKQKIQFAWIDNFRRGRDDPDETDTTEENRDWFNGQNTQLSIKNDFKLSESFSIIAGFDWNREKGDSFQDSFGSVTDFSKSIIRSKGYYLENKINLYDKFYATFAYRLEDNSLFGNNDTYKIDALYSFDTGTKLKGSFATGFKAPTLFQLFAGADDFFDGGNRDLQPEDSQSYEAGLEQSLWDEKLTFNIVFFHTLFKNLIDAKFNPSTGITDKFSNVSKARAFGIENQIFLNLTDKLKISSNYAWLDTENKDDRTELLRRAKNKFDINFDYSMTEKLDLSLSARYIGHKPDSGGKLIKAYTRVDVSANYNLNDNLGFFGRIENLLNEKYEEVKGFQTPVFSAYTGLRYSF